MLRSTFVDHGLACALNQSGWLHPHDKPVAVRRAGGRWRSDLLRRTSRGSALRGAASFGNLTSTWGVPARRDAAMTPPGNESSRCPAHLRICGCSGNQMHRTFGELV
eukprot:2798063-Prymnesium_polylepis.1